MRKISTLLLLLLISQLGNAQPLFTENFNYGASGGSIITLSAGKWVENTTASTTNIIQYSPAASLVFPSFPTGNGKLALLNTGQDITAAISTAVNTGDIYATLLVNFSATQATGDYFFHFMPTTTTNSFFSRLFVKSSGTGISFGLMKNNGGATPYSTNTYLLNTTYCLVLKYSFNADGTTNDATTLYVFDAATGLPATEPTSSELNITANTDATSIGAIALRQGAATAGASGSVDNIYVTTSWADILSAVTPVNLKSFTSKQTTKGIVLNWQSSNEINFDYYSLEKSFDGRNFSSIAIIKGKLVNGNMAAYSFEDIDPLMEKQYYRLRMVDKDGTAKYSHVLLNQKKANIQLMLYPNPVVNTMVVSHPKITEGASLQVSDALGKLIKLVPITIGATQTVFDASLLAKGAYILMYKHKGNTSSISFVK